ncbi:MAG: serine hydrolase [Candidatus Tectomicrobia bacterium]|uniref:Serine hydrolase n=1 Tax=Tectimicrobiota bacterium TaxID=2528274 RepID=A0A932FWM8_UNCTE|nr:serine hydrolase [Candidatus Tectomicrobia bacterium]
MILVKWLIPFKHSQAEGIVSRATSPASWVKFPLEFKESQNSHFEGSGSQGQRVIYTLRPDLQRSMERLLQRYRVPYGAVVALEPSTGKILAMASHSAVGHPDIRNFCLRATFPAASIFKVITASAALDLGMMAPESQITYQGNMYALSPGKLYHTGGVLTSLAEALARSNNVAFGKVAQIVGAEGLRKYARAFGFNRTLAQELPLEPSRAYIPQEAYDLARAGAGFGEVTLSPLHGAMIAATIANQGEMMQPHLVEEVWDLHEEKVYQAHPTSLSRVVSRETTLGINQMMQETIRIGTSRRAFHAGGRPYFPHMAISGKTGSLSGTDPVGHYSWFIGFAPAEAPQVAVAALVISPGGWSAIKGSALARLAFQAYFEGGTEGLPEELRLAQTGPIWGGAPEVTHHRVIKKAKGKRARHYALKKARVLSKKQGHRRSYRLIKTKVRKRHTLESPKIKKAVATGRLRIKKAYFSSHGHSIKGKAATKGKVSQKKGVKQKRLKKRR